MTRSIQCDNCGAVLHKDDVFCGECGAPRPSVSPPTGPTKEPQAPAPVAAPSVPRSDSDTVWRVVAAILGIGGALLCLFGFVLFLLFGLMEGEGLTPVENWLISAICCLLPIAGTGMAIALIGLVVWWARLRKR